MLGVRGRRRVLATERPDNHDAPVTVSLFGAVAPVAITAVSPSAGSGAGGTSVTITGTGFGLGATVMVGTAPASNVIVFSPTTIVATTPWQTVGAVDVTVTNTDGSSSVLSGGFTFTRPQRYFAEGATIPPFECQFALANPTAIDASVTLRFLRNDGQVFTRDLTVPAMGRYTLDAKTVAGLESAEFSTAVESDIPVVADRTMMWGPGLNAGHAETSIEAPSTTWYLAEGATHSNFDLFYTIQNPNASAANLTVRYLRPGGLPPLDKQYRGGRQQSLQHLGRPGAVPRRVGQPGAGGDRRVGAHHQRPAGDRRAFDVPRARQRRAFRAGHNSAGVTAPALDWFLAEGATGSFFDLFILVANPNETDARVRATYLLTDGSTLSKDYTVQANSRFNIWVDLEQFPDGSGNLLLANAALSTTISALNGVPVIVERAMWWPGPTAATWAEAHNSPGSTATGTKWALAEGEQGGARSVETYYTIANTSPFDGQAKVTFLFDDGASPAEVTIALPANSRTNVLSDVRPACAASLWGAPPLRGDHRESRHESGADRRRTADVLGCRRHSLGCGHQRAGDAHPVGGIEPTRPVPRDEGVRARGHSRGRGHEEVGSLNAGR